MLGNWGGQRRLGKIREGIGERTTIRERGRREMIGELRIGGGDVRGEGKEEVKRKKKAGVEGEEKAKEKKEGRGKGREKQQRRAEKGKNKTRIEDNNSNKIPSNTTDTRDGDDNSVAATTSGTAKTRAASTGRRT